MISAAILGRLPKELAEALIDAFTEIERNYVHRKWKASELDAGHFVEAARRIIELKTTGTFTPIGKNLPNFNDAVLTKYENGSGDESYRILIPRVLKAIYGIRNKRGVGHLGPISPNEMDATLILYNAKWVLAEIVRLESGMAPEDTQRSIESIVERQIPLLWKDESLVRVADTSVEVRDQILLHLYDTSPQTNAVLQEKCEYKNGTNFRKILKRLHDRKLIHHGADGNCRIMPAGSEEAEAVIVARS